MHPQTISHRLLAIGRDLNATLRNESLPSTGSTCIELVAVGNLRAKKGDQSLDLPQGSIRIRTASAPWTYSHIDTEHTERHYLIYNEHGNPCPDPERTFYTPLPHEFRILFEMLRTEHERSSPQKTAICSHLLKLLLLKIDQLESTTTEGSESAGNTYKSVRQIIDDHSTDLMSVNDIADVTGLTASYLCRIFKRFGKTSPYKYLMQRKMGLARQLLSTGQHNVSETAHILGFDSPFNFSRAFKAVHHASPSKFKRSI